MASKSNLASTALLITFNLLFFSMVTSTYVPCPPPPSKIHKPPPSHPKTPTPPFHPKSPPPPPSYPKFPPPHKATCPIDTLKLGVCANLLHGLVGIVIGVPPKAACCSLIEDLADVEAAVCLCTALKAKVLGISLNVPISLTLLLNDCGKGVPSGFQCA